MVGKVNLDFQVVSSGDPKVLIVIDTSTWSGIITKPAIIEIVTPVSKVPVVHYFNKNEVNVYTSANLLTGCSDIDKLIDLPDGIYQITLKGSPDTYNICRNILRTEKTTLELDKLYIDLDLLCKYRDDQIYNTLTDIDLLLRATQAHVRYDNLEQAHKLLMEAQRGIESLRGCNGCGKPQRRPHIRRRP